MDSIIGQTGEQRVGSREDVQRIINSLKPPRSGNARVLVIDQAPIMRARNGGFPKFMYHATLPPVYVLREDQEEELSKLGYGMNYIHQPYPKALFRRNMDERYAERPDPTTGVAPNPPYVETITANDAAHEERIRKIAKPKRSAPEGGILFVGEWVAKYDEIDPLPETPTEAPEVTIARLEGELVAVRETRGKKTA